MNRTASLLRTVGRLRRDKSGLALLEFAFSLPVLLLLSLTGAELTSYVITQMRISQVALHLADNAARIGAGTQLQAKKITEADVNDLLTGAGLLAGELDLYRHGRVIISSLEPMANPNTTGRFRIRWQRCRGSKLSYGSNWGTVGQSNATNMTGMGPAGRQAIAPEDGVTIFVEVQYEYQPIVRQSLVPVAKIEEIASMMVRDRRDTTGGVEGIYQLPDVPPSTC